MSQENVAVVHESVKRFSDGDLAGLGALYAEDAVVVPPDGWPDGARAEGRDEVISQYARIQADWESQSMRVSRTATNAKWVVTEQPWSVRGAASGMQVDMTVYGVFRLEHGLIAEARFFWAWDEALEAVGLSE